MTPIFSDRFQHDGRGPELQRMVWEGSGSQRLVAIEYFNPADVYEPANLKHVALSGVQVVMVTPEEVIGPEQIREIIATYRPASMFDLGRSRWFLSFSQQHLGGCRHFQLLFYDELIDVICEGVECIDGAYRGAAQHTAGADR